MEEGISFSKKGVVRTWLLSAHDCRALQGLPGIAFPPVLVDTERGRVALVPGFSVGAPLADYAVGTDIGGINLRRGLGKGGITWVVWSVSCSGEEGVDVRFRQGSSWWCSGVRRVYRRRSL